MAKTSSPSCSPCGPWWRLPLLLALLLAAIWLTRDRSGREATTQPADPRAAERVTAGNGQTVALTIDFGDGVTRQYAPLAWRNGMTVYDLLREAAGNKVQLDVHGAGASAFVAGIGRAANEGATGRNWIYQVNSRHADRSFAIYELMPGDHVLWTFAPQE